MRAQPGELEETNSQTASGSEKPWRVFCAVELPASLRERLMQHIARLKAAVPQNPASWSRENNIHLTLKFFGDTAQSRISDLDQAVDRAVKEMAPFRIIVEQTGVFPKLAAPKVLWVGIADQTDRLAGLKQNLEDECANVGFVREERAFHPHLTIARLRMRKGGRELASAHKNTHFEPVEVVVSELCVIRSELSSRGAKYSVLSRHLLES